MNGLCRVEAWTNTTEVLVEPFPHGSVLHTQSLVNVWIVTDTTSAHMPQRLPMNIPSFAREDHATSAIIDNIRGNIHG